MKFQAVIFDNDGVIVDSEPLHHVAEQATMSRYGVEVSIEEFQKYVGIGTEQMFSDWVQRFNLQAEPGEILPRHQENLNRIFREQVTLTPHVKSFIEQLHQKQVKLAVASSSYRELVEIGLRKHSLLSYFHAVVCSDDVTHTKPNPELFLMAAQQLWVTPDACLVIEDSSAGIAAAKSAGMYCIAFRNPNSGAQDLSQADQIVNDFREIQFG